MTLRRHARWQADTWSAALAVLLCAGLGVLGQPDWLWSAGMAAGLVIRRTLPWMFAGLIVVTSGAHLVIDARLLLPGDLLLLVAFYTLALYAPSRSRKGVLALGTAYVGVLLAQTGANEGVRDIPRTFAPVALIAVSMLAAWAVGLLERQKREALVDAEQRQRLLERDAEVRPRLAAHEERERISNDIHDVLAHTLTGIVVQAESGRAVSVEDQPRELFARISATGRAALHEVRGLLAIDENRDTHPTPGFNDVDDLVASFDQAGLRIAQTECGDRAELAPGMSLAIYRVIQESLTNALRHGRDGSASLILEWTEEALTVSVVNVAEHEVHLSASTNRRGLAGIRRRCALYEANVEIHSGQEFSVVTTWPLTEPRIQEAP